MSIHYQYIPYIWPLLASAAITVLLLAYAMSKRNTAKGAKSFVLSMIVLTVWTCANLMEMTAVSLSSKLFWANVQYFAYCYSPVTLISLCMEFTGYDRWNKNKKILWLTVIPTIIIILVWTDGFHGLIRYGIHMDYSGAIPVIDKKYGPLFFIHAVYSHSLNIAAWILLVRAVFFKNTVYRKQAAILLVGLSFIILPNIFYISGFSPLKFDVTPMFFGLAGLITAWGVFKYKLFDVVPVAWATVIKTMDAGVMVLDLQDRILDMNHAFEKIINTTVSKASTKYVKNICSHIPELAGAFTDGGPAQREFKLQSGSVTKVYEALISPLTDDKGILIGRLVVTYDITSKKQEQQEYLRQQWKQAVMMEKERHARDLHDNLGQVLGFISLQAQGIRQELSSAGIDVGLVKLNRLIEVAQSANSEIREYIRNARNEKLEEEDFVTALQQLINSFEKQADIKTKLDIPFDFNWEEISANIKINILNIVKEALNNIRKHSDAGNAAVSFLVGDGQLDVSIEDDGKGFDVQHYKAGGKTSFGLDIMRERAKEINAIISIESEIGKGSRVLLSKQLREGVETDEGYAG